MIIAEATIDNIADIQRIRLSVRENILSDPSRVPASRVADMIVNRGKGWVCRIDGTIRGFSFADLKDESLWALFIEPGFDKRGIGRQLHDRAVAWLFEQRVQTIWLSTEPGSRAEAFYRAAGWVPKGLEPNGDRRFELTRQGWLQS